MKKTMVVTIIVDDVELSSIDELSEKLEEVVSKYQFKRIDINLNDYPMVKNTLTQG